VKTVPIYEFVCQNCNYEFELIRSFSDNSTPTCPHCANQQVDRQVGRPAIHFKGSGWYINDSKKASKSSANGKKTSNDESGSADKPTDSKSSDNKATNGAGRESKSSENKSSTESATKERA